MTLPQNASIGETRAQMDRFEQHLAGDPDIVSWSSYVGEGAIRFYLPLDQQLANAFFGQAVVETRSLEARERVQARLRALARSDFVGIDTFIHPLDIGPPVGRPVQYRISGQDIEALRAQALKMATLMSANPHLDPPTFDWNEPGKVIRVDINQDKARQLGINSSDVASILNGIVGGTTITQVRDSIYLVNVVARAETSERNRVETLRSLQIPTGSGSVVPLLSFATLRPELEQPIVWRRDRIPTITVRAAIHDDTQPATVVAQLAPAVADLSTKALPNRVQARGGRHGRGKRQGTGPAGRPWCR